MPDQIVFNDGLSVVGSPVGTSLLSGTVSVDYSTNAVSGSLGVTALGALSAQTYTSLALSQTGINNGVPSYTLSGNNGLTQIAVSYNGQLPTMATTSISALGTGASIAAGTGGVSASVVCFAAGTLIRTPHGDVPVETLEIGDLVVTAASEHRRVKWVGHRTIRREKFADPAAVMPVCIAAGAFGRDLPEGNLVLSPGHALCLTVVEEMLVPASVLVNGTTIKRLDCEEVTYWHVELDSHDIVLANGMPVETYIDVGNRGFFGADVVPLDPARDVRDLTGYCRPFTDRGPVVAAVRNRLRARALGLGWTLDVADDNALWIEADGAIVRPRMEGVIARFLLPATAQNVWLVCDTNVPADIADDGDTRRLGVCVGTLTVDDGLQTRRCIASDQAALDTGFYPAEAMDGVTRRWTNGRARLPAHLWEGCRHEFFLSLTFAADPLPRWTAPPAALPQAFGTGSDPRLRLVDNAA